MGYNHTLMIAVEIEFGEYRELINLFHGKRRTDLEKEYHGSCLVEIYQLDASTPGGSWLWCERDTNDVKHYTLGTQFCYLKQLEGNFYWKTLTEIQESYDQLMRIRGTIFPIEKCVIMLAEATAPFIL